MRLIVGLGNPGSEYQRTRHNIGFWLVEALAKRWGIRVNSEKFSSRMGEGVVGSEKVGLLMPQTFMNRSGRAVSEAVSFFRLSHQELLVAHDDLDLVLGKVKLDFDRGAAGHRGVSSLIETVGKDFYRIRMGIGRPPAEEEVESFVLSPFLKEEVEEAQAMVTQGEDLAEKWLENKI